MIMLISIGHGRRPSRHAPPRLPRLRRLPVSVRHVGRVVANPSPYERTNHRSEQPGRQQGPREAIAGDGPAKHSRLRAEDVPVQLRLVVEDCRFGPNSSVHVLSGRAYTHTSRATIYIKNDSSILQYSIVGRRKGAYIHNPPPAFLAKQRGYYSYVLVCAWLDCAQQ